MNLFARRTVCWSLCALGVTLAPWGDAKAHPHVFVDGGIDFVIGSDNTLAALDVTWRFDAFETLYILSSYDLQLNADGALDEADRQMLVEKRGAWPDDFEGTAHLSVAGEPVPLQRPADMDMHVRDGRLEVTFSRALNRPLNLRGQTVDVAFYEATYFYAFAITDTPEMKGAADCDVAVTRFDPDTVDMALASMLAALGREENSGIDDVGATFADRISLQCA